MQKLQISVAGEQGIHCGVCSVGFYQRTRDISHPLSSFVPISKLLNCIDNLGINTMNNYPLFLATMYVKIRFTI